MINLYEIILRDITSNNKRWNFDFHIINFSVLNDDVSRATFCANYVSQLIYVTRASTHIKDVNNKNKQSNTLTVTLLKQGYKYKT